MTDAEWLTTTPIAHRGLHSEDVPENSTRAFREAIDAGYAIELDVQLTSDDVPIVFHDRAVSWGEGSTDPIRQLPYTHIRERGIPGSPYAIPRLHTVLQTIDGQVPILIDIKNVSTDIGPIESAVESILATYGGPFAVQSFNPLTVRYFCKNRPSWPRGQVAECFTGVDGASRWRTALVRRLVFSVWNRPDFIAYRGSDLPYWPVTMHRTLGVPILAWTLDDPDAAKRVLEYADNVIFEGYEPPVDGYHER